LRNDVVSAVRLQPPRLSPLSPSLLSQLSLNNKQLTQMLKSTAPVQEEEEDPLAYYEKHTSQIEARPVWAANTHS